MSSCFIQLLYCQKLKQEARYAFPYKFVVDIFPELSVLEAIFGPPCKCKGIYVFQNHLTVQLNFYLNFNKVINLQCNDPTKGKYQEKNLREFSKCLPSEAYAQSCRFMD